MTTTLPLFAAFGIELEYMIVKRDSLDVAPVADQLIKKVAGEYTNEIYNGEIAWSNELVSHVIELKTNGPAASLKALPEAFLKNLQQINELLGEMDACLMPTGMHPWMNPYRETVLWPHDNREIYDTYNRIFNCEGHGWSNLQSMHINLPFANDKQFAVLHSAIRVLLPILPALAASSPIVESRYTGKMDTRLETYRMNSVRIPSITGQVVPEVVSSKEEYRQKILDPMYRDISEYDPQKILQDEWLNSRGAIARFDRNAIEIRVLDTQETPMADLAIAAFIIETLKNLSSFEWSDTNQQNLLSNRMLSGLFLNTITSAEQTIIDDRAYLRVFDFPDKKASTQDLLVYLREEIDMEDHLPADANKFIDVIIKQGPLARRIVKATGTDVKKSRLQETYRALCNCIDKGTLFTGID